MSARMASSPKAVHAGATTSSKTWMPSSYAKRAGLPSGASLSPIGPMTKAFIAGALSPVFIGAVAKMHACDA